MKLEANSKHLLAITKSKAKMYEFDVDDRYHIEIYEDPSKLLITCIGILGELSHLEARREGESTYIDGLKEQLVQVGQFFDALNYSKLEPEISDYLLLVGAASYYLADMPGSATVLANTLKYDVTNLTPNYLEALLVWLIKADIEAVRFHFEKCELRSQIDAFVNAFLSYFRQQGDLQTFHAASESLRQGTYELGNDREFLFVDVIIAIAGQRINYSSLQCLPLYSDIPVEKWLGALNKPDFIREFWPAQRLLGAKGVLKGASAIVQMPTSAGKTKSTELIIRSAFLSERASLAVIVAPFRALCREISGSFSKAFEGEDIAINELRDIPLLSDEESYFIKQLLDVGVLGEYSANTIIISTPEKLVYLLRHEPRLASKIDLLLLDEGHQFDTGTRGVTYELLIASLKKQVPEGCQKILISAVMSNAESINDWLNGEAGIAVSGNKMLPTIRSIAFASWKTKLGQLEYYVQDEYRDRSFFVPRLLEETVLALRPRETTPRVFPNKETVSSIAAYLGIRLAPQGPVAVFCGDKRSIVSISKELVDYFERGLPYRPPIDSSDGEEIGRISNLAQLHWGADYTLTQSIGLGILPHSSNVPNGLRVAIEWAMENNKARLVLCTSTLAQGVNLPIKYLVISSTFQGRAEISTRDFHNLIGRAGRSGYHTEGSIIFADPKIYDMRRNRRNKWRWDRAIHLLDFSNAEECLSSLLKLVQPFELVEIDIMEFIANPAGIRKNLLEQASEGDLDITDFLYELDTKKTMIQAVESYFLAYLKDNPSADDSVFSSLCKETLAYSLAEENEKSSLEDAFEIIARRVQLIDKEKYAYYGKAILGLEQLAEIEAWLVEKLGGIRENAGNIEALLRLCWPLLVSVGASSLMTKVQPENMRVEIANMWINGANYEELQSFAKARKVVVQAKSKQYQITMEHIVDFTDKSLGYDIMLVVGALADIMEGNGVEDEIVDAVRLLQSRLKYGVKTILELWLFQRGYVDREICKLISSFMTEKGVDSNNFGFDILEIYGEKVDELISNFPTYFQAVRNS